MFPTKCQGQNDRMGRTVMSCFCQILDFIIGFATKISIFKHPPLLRFLCLINSFYRRYVSCMYNISNISNIYQIYPIYPIYWRLTIKKIVFRELNLTVAGACFSQPRQGGQAYFLTAFYHYCWCNMSRRHHKQVHQDFINSTDFSLRGLFS